MTTDQNWTHFVRSWREIGALAYRAWFVSPERIREILKRHPLPWIIEEDWTKEVLAADGCCVGKFQTYADAQRFIDSAEGIEQ